MQTFLPYKDFTETAKVLDSKRLNKQVLECYQILNVLSNDDPRAGWRNHPAVKMWRGSEKVLWGGSEPAWYNDAIKMAKVNATHKANLYKKDPIQYFQFFDSLSDSDNQPCCPDRKEPCKYYWVTHEENYETAKNI